MTSFPLLAALAALALQPAELVSRDTVDLTEINHFYDENGRLVFEQLIYYDWSPDQGQYTVRAWRLLKSPSQIPSRNHGRDGFVSVWQDGGVLREIRSRATRETWTQYDPELLQRKQLPKEQRRELSRPYLGANP